MYLDGLDELDQKIVRLLIENARVSYSDLGEKIGLSRVAVKARIQALEQRLEQWNAENLGTIQLPEDVVSYLNGAAD